MAVEDGEHDPEVSAEKEYGGQGKEGDAESLAAGLFAAENKEGGDGEEGEEQEDELGVKEEGAEVGEEEEGEGKEELDEYGVNGSAVAVFSGEEGEGGKILADGLRDAGADVGEGSDRGDEAEKDEEVGEDLAAPRKYVFRRPGREPFLVGQGGEFGEGDGAEEGEVQNEIEEEHEGGSGQQGNGDGGGGVTQFSGDVRGRVPAGVGIGDEDEGDGEIHAKEDRPIARGGKDANGLRVMVKSEQGETEADDEKDLHSREEVLETLPKKPAAQMYACAKKN